jgi:hypothetical protein
MRALIVGLFLVFGSSGIVAAENAPASPKCETNADCVPAQCCHPTSCVHKSQAPDCKETVCTMDCRPGTLDCGNGKCVCNDGACSADINKK